MPYYGLYIPSAVDGGGSAATGGTGGVNAASAGAGGEGNSNLEATASPNVFREKIDALRFLKSHKDARLREFNNNEDAVKYALTGYEVVQTKYNDVQTSTAAIEKAAFRAPTRQELAKFRRMIENDEYEQVKTIIWDNPRYLVSSGDTPTILQEGCRFNAMHICAMSIKPRIAELILQTVSNPDFVGLLTGKKNDVEMCKDFAANLLDLYLNIPEKVRSETPLHLAAKFGAVEVVEVLMSYPECKMTLNAQGCLPVEIVGSRINRQYLNNKIYKLLRNGFYVPVIRYMDNTIPPQIGNPFSLNNPPNLQSDPFSPELKIQALAGPMNKEDAEGFCRRWKTPPRLGSKNSSSLIANYISPVKMRTPGKALLSNRNSDSPTSTLHRKSIFNATPQRLSDKLNSYDSETENGIKSLDQEQIDESKNITEADKQNGNHSKVDASTFLSTDTENNSNKVNTESSLYVATDGYQQRFNVNMFNSGLCPNTPLLRQKKHLFSTYREQSVPSPVVFDQCLSNESFGAECDLYDSPGFKERYIKLSDHEKGLEVIGRNLARKQGIDWKEYWDFLDEFIDISCPEGLEKLENFFTQRVRKEDIAKKASEAIANTTVNMGDVCSALENFGFTKDADTIDGSCNGGYVNQNSRYSQSTTNTPTTPYTCVEKSLQVFAKRMTKTILNNIDNIVSINDSFFSELKRMKSLICSFKDDSRFLDVDFTKVHSRFANLIANYLENSQDVDLMAKDKIKKSIQHILFSPGERKEQLHCVCQKILECLDDSSEQILPENLKTEAICSKVWFEQNECKCQWEANLSRKTSRRNRMETRYRNHQQANQAVAAESQRIKDEQKKNKKTAEVNLTEWRDPSSASDSDTNEVFWSDFGSSDRDEDECWLTPPESLSHITLENSDSEEDKYNIFIYGNEPTKRDLDVLNAINHIQFNQGCYPNLYNWKQAVLQHLNDGIENFPTPSVVKKTHSLTMNNSNNREANSQRLQHPKIQQLPIPKRLFMSPSRP